MRRVFCKTNEEEDHDNGNNLNTQKIQSSQASKIPNKIIKVQTETAGSLTTANQNSSNKIDLRMVTKSITEEKVGFDGKPKVLSAYK